MGTPLRLPRGGEYTPSWNIEREFPGGERVPPVSSAPTLRVGAAFLHLLQRLLLLKNDEERSDSRALEPRRSLIIGMEVADYLLYFKYCSLSANVVTLHSR